jgi:hypothetical protein
MERYAHPYERPIYGSLIESADMEELVTSYFRHAYKGVERKKDWQWDELHQFNSSLIWDDDLWVPKHLQI